MAKANTSDNATSRTVGAPTLFIDKAFKRRTLVLEDGRVFLVEKSRISAVDPALIAYLDQHAEFERAPEQSAGA